MGRTIQLNTYCQTEATIEMKYRDHRGTLKESLDTTKEIGSLGELKDYLTTIYGDGKVEINKYGTGIDGRCGWDTHIVTHNGNAVGFTDGKL